MTVYYARSFYNIYDHNREVRVGDVFRDGTKSGRFLKVHSIHSNTGGYIVVEAHTAYNNSAKPLQIHFYEILTGRRNLRFIKGNFRFSSNYTPPPPPKAYFSGKGMPRYLQKEICYAS